MLLWFAVLHLFLAFDANAYDAGVKALEEQRYEDAVKLLQTALASSKEDDYTLHFDLGLAYGYLGKTQEGIAEYKKALELKPDLYEAQLNLSLLLIRAKQPSDAVPHLNAAISEKPNEFRPYFFLGEAQLEEMEYTKAEQAYTAALAINPNSAPAEGGLARALAEQNRLTEAAQHYKKAAELDPAYRKAPLELARIYEQRGHPDEAIAIYSQFPDDPGAQEHEGMLLLDQGKAAEAVKSLEIAVAQSPSIANRTALAMAYGKNGQSDKAFALLDPLLKDKPDDYDLHMIYGRMLMDARRFLDAQQQFARCTQIRPENPESWSELAQVQVMLENYPAAIADLDKVRELHAEKAGHLFLRAIVLDKTKQVKPALDAYQRFLAASEGQFPDQEFQARQRVRILEKEAGRR